MASLLELNPQNIRGWVVTRVPPPPLPFFQIFIATGLSTSAPYLNVAKLSTSKYDRYFVGLLLCVLTQALALLPAT